MIVYKGGADRAEDIGMKTSLNILLYIILIFERYQ